MVLAFEQYRAYLLETYNIELLQEVPNSPERNLLDLGVWRSMGVFCLRYSISPSGINQLLASKPQVEWMSRSPSPKVVEADGHPFSFLG